MNLSILEYKHRKTMPHSFEDRLPEETDEQTVPLNEDDEEELEELEQDPDETESDLDDENHMTIRAKWILDGCKNLDEIIQRLEDEISYYKELKERGWQLTGTVDDDYGFMRRQTN
jgi:hypothetical protein